MGPVKPVYHTSLVAVVTPTDRPKSVCNRCVIELFVALFVLSICPFEISAGVGDFVIALSRISSFFILISMILMHLSQIVLNLLFYAAFCSPYNLKIVGVFEVTEYISTNIGNSYWSKMCSTQTIFIFKN